MEGTARNNNNKNQDETNKNLEFSLELSAREFFEERMSEALDQCQTQVSSAVFIYLSGLLIHFLDVRNLTGEFDRRDEGKREGELFEEGRSEDLVSWGGSAQTGGKGWGKIRRQGRTFGELFLMAHESLGSEQIQMFKDIGDRTLYISGFFGDSLSRKLVDIDYYAKLGSSAYQWLSTAVHNREQSQVYFDISKRYLKFVDVFSYISEKVRLMGIGVGGGNRNGEGGAPVAEKDILRLYERYLKTGSELARRELLNLGICPAPGVGESGGKIPKE